MTINRKKYQLQHSYSNVEGIVMLVVKMLNEMQTKYIHDLRIRNSDF